MAEGGPGAGTLVGRSAGGAGHGGNGGAASSSYTAMGKAYGSYMNPVSLGSSGSRPYGSSSSMHPLLFLSCLFLHCCLLSSLILCFNIYVAPGALGGGSILIEVSGTTTVNGIIEANGANAVLGTGGGSGGSILIKTSTFTGSGDISSIGGSGSINANSNGANGAGGRIAVHFSSNSFGGTFLLYGGDLSSSSVIPGGPGTALLYNTVSQHKVLIVDNNNRVISTPKITSFATTMGSVAWIEESGAVVFNEIRLTRRGGLACKNADVSYQSILLTICI